MKPLARAGLVLFVLGLLGFTAVGVNRHRLRQQSDAGKLVMREQADDQRIEHLLPLFVCTVAVVAGTGMMLLAQRVR